MKHSARKLKRHFRQWEYPVSSNNPSCTIIEVDLDCTLMWTRSDVCLRSTCYNTESLRLLLMPILIKLDGASYLHLIYTISTRPDIY